MGKSNRNLHPFPHMVGLLENPAQRIVFSGCYPDGRASTFNAQIRRLLWTPISPPRFAHSETSLRPTIFLVGCISANHRLEKIHKRGNGGFRGVLGVTTQFVQNRTVSGKANKIRAF